MKSVGKIIYSPSSHLGSNEKWAILSCDDEIGKYYRHLFTLQYPYLNNRYHGKLARPIWGSHISFIRNEKITNSHLWKLKENQIIEFEYDPEVKDNIEYFWMNVRCDALLDIRSKYGLMRQPKFGLHLTIGRTTQC